jgi:hypothetical protein
MGILSSNQFNNFIKVLLDAYPVRFQFAQMLKTRLDKSLDAMATTGALETDIFYVIQTAEAQGWTHQLINAARESRPGNNHVINFAQQFNLASTRKSGKELERIIKDGNGFLDVAAWRSALGRAETRVCRVEVSLNSGNIAYGTGFLIGPSTVITNYHVIEPLMKNLAKSEEVILRFDYKTLEDCITLNQGSIYKLEDGSDWHIVSSPYSLADLQGEETDKLPNENELDFALLLIKGEPASDCVGKIIEPEAPQRGFFEMPNPPSEVNPGEPILILQHPHGDCLKLAIDMEAGLEKNGNGTRIRYTTNTLPGSSGSPCFNINWEIVALHHAGDPNYGELHKAGYNQGIPFAMILKYIRDNRFEHLLSE